MKVLMFGWEFPPHISGGLGTACYGLTKGLAATGEVETIFVVPKAYGDEDQKAAKIVAAGDVKVIDKTDLSIQKETNKIVRKETVEKPVWVENKVIVEETEIVNLTYIEVASRMLPYLSVEEYEVVMKEKQVEQTKFRISEEKKLVYVQEEIEHEVTVEERLFAETDDEGRYPFTGKYGTNLYFEVAKYAEVATFIAKEHEYDVIHAHDWLTYLAGIEAKNISGKPLVIHVHATEFDRSGQSVNQIVYDIEKLGMEAADKIITVSNLTKNIVVEKYGINPKKVVTVYNAVEPQKSENVAYTKTVDEKIVTFLGRVTFQKGPEYFVEACHQVYKRVGNVRFVMAGSGDLLRKMIRRAAQLKMSDRFHFTDFLKGDDVTRMFALSDVYVMPSVSEPFGISPLEAMRSNTPVIISKQSGVAEILKHAITVDFWDVDAIADAIYGLLTYNSLPKMFQLHGKEEVDKLKWDNAAQNVREVYLSAIKESKLPADKPLSTIKNPIEHFKLLKTI